MSFDIKNGRFQFTFRFDPAVEAPLEVFVPAYHYEKGAKVIVTKGRFELDLKKQHLEYFPDADISLHTVTLFPG